MNSLGTAKWRHSFSQVYVCPLFKISLRHGRIIFLEKRNLEYSIYIQKLKIQLESLEILSCQLYIKLVQVYYKYVRSAI